jgi:CheY-like chemotaxis protein
MTVEKLTILIADHEAMNRKLLRVQLASPRHTGREVASGHEAMQKAEGTPDLILLGLMMPGMNGL